MFQQGDFLGDGVPNNARIDAKVFMDDEIAKVFNQSPFNGRYLVFDFVGKVADGLSDDNKLPKSRRIGFAIPGKGLVIVPQSEILYGSDRFIDIRKLETGISFKHSGYLLRSFL